MHLDTTADITSGNPIHKLNWNLQYHLRKLSALCLEAKTSHFKKYAFESNLADAEGLYNQLAFHQMNFEMAAQTDQRITDRLFNAIALTAIAA